MLHGRLTSEEIDVGQALKDRCFALTEGIPLIQKRSVAQQPTNRESMTTTQITITPANVISEQGHVALAVLAAHLGADLEVLTNEETGDEVASLARLGETEDDEDFEVHVMPDPYCPSGTGWVAVSDGQAIVTGPSVPEVVKRYQDWCQAQA
jgi:hypothetical protein